VTALGRLAGPDRTRGSVRRRSCPRRWLRGDVIAALRHEWPRLERTGNSSRAASPGLRMVWAGRAWVGMPRPPAGTQQERWPVPAFPAPGLMPTLARGIPERRRKTWQGSGGAELPRRSQASRLPPARTAASPIDRAPGVIGLGHGAVLTLAARWTLARDRRNVDRRTETRRAVGVARRRALDCASDTPAVLRRATP
jgi:hypothetical protein